MECFPTVFVYFSTSSIKRFHMTFENCSYDTQYYSNGYHFGFISISDGWFHAFLTINCLKRPSTEDCVSASLCRHNQCQRDRFRGLTQNILLGTIYQ